MDKPLERLHGMDHIHKITNHVVNTKLRSFIQLDGGAVFLAGITTATLGGAILYIVVERPFLKLRDRIEKRIE